MINVNDTGIDEITVYRTTDSYDDIWWVADYLQTHKVNTAKAGNRWVATYLEVDRELVTALCASHGLIASPFGGGVLIA